MYRIRFRRHPMGPAPAGRARRLGFAAVRRSWNRRIARRFPANVYVRRLVEAALSMGIAFEPSPVPGEWMYHPGRRAILVWEPDLRHQSLSYLVAILAHELGHALDLHRRARPPGAAGSAVPPAGRLRKMEQAAFVYGFLLLKSLAIPVSLSQYTAMIEPPMDEAVDGALRRRLCCLLDRWGPEFARAASAAPALPAALSPVA